MCFGPIFDLCSRASGPRPLRKLIFRAARACAKNQFSFFKKHDFFSFFLATNRQSPMKTPVLEFPIGPDFAYKHLPSTCGVPQALFFRKKITTSIFLRPAACRRRFFFVKNSVFWKKVNFFLHQKWRFLMFFQFIRT